MAIEWQARHSFYVGDYYLWPPTPAEPEEQQGPARLVLQLNFFDEVDQELAYPEWPEHHVLLHATGLDPDWVERLEATGAEVLDDE